MLEYYSDNSSINVELVITSGGIAVTGRSPSMQIWSEDHNLYFDLVSRTFTGAPGNTSLLLLSAVDGLYRANWDISGLFSSNSGTYLTFEYVDGTSIAIDQVRITPKHRVHVAGGGGGQVAIKGLWTVNQKKKLLKDVADMKNTLKDFRETAITLLRKILGKKALTKEDLDSITKLKERDLAMYQELLKLLDLRETSSEREVFAKLEEYIRLEETAKKALLEKLDALLKPKALEQLYEEDDD